MFARLPTKVFGLLLAVFQTTGTLKANQVPAASPQEQPSTLSAFVKQLRRDAGLRARFAAGPRSTLLAAGLDAAAFELPDRLDDIDVLRIVAQWEALSTPAFGPIAEQSTGTTDHPTNFHPPVPVYGPPSGIPPRPPEPLRPPPPPEPQPLPSPPAPVYGPPPGRR